MRYRLAAWDVPMPDPLVAYWTAWNEHDAGLVREHLDRAVDVDVVWNDPRDSFTGIEQLEAAILRLHESKPQYRFVIASEIDHHHDRYRYRWDMVGRDRVLMEGIDVVTIAAQSGADRPGRRLLWLPDTGETNRQRDPGCAQTTRSARAMTRSAIGGRWSTDGAGDDEVGDPVGVVAE